jgi:amino acid transporter
MSESTESSPLLLSRSSSISTKSSLRTDAVRRRSPIIHTNHVSQYAVLPESSTNGRSLTWTSTYILVISRVIGSGIFATPGSIIKSVGSPGLSLALWFTGALITFCGLAIDIEYGCMLPRSGGEKVYLEYTYQRPKFLAGTLVATQAVLLGFTASNCIVFAQYILFAFGVEGTDIQKKSIAVGLLTFITVIHGCYLKAGVRLQNILGGLKIVLICFMIISSIFVMLFHLADTKSNIGVSEQEDLMSNIWKYLWRGSEWSWGVVSTALFKVFYSYAGLSNANLVLNEVKDPVRTLKTVSLTALATACGFYTLINWAYLLVIPVEDIKGSGELVAALFFERIFGVAVGRVILPVAIALSAAGNVMVVTFALVSAMYSMFMNYFFIRVFELKLMFTWIGSS